MCATCKRCGGKAWEYVHAIDGDHAEYQCRNCLRCVSATVEEIENPEIEA